MANKYMRLSFFKIRKKQVKPYIIFTSLIGSFKNLVMPGVCRVSDNELSNIAGGHVIGTIF